MNYIRYQKPVQKIEFFSIDYPQTKFEAIISKDVERDKFQVKTRVSLQILDQGLYNFLPVVPMVMILVFLKIQCRELSKNVYFYPILTYSFRVMILSSKMCHNTPNLSHPPSPPPLLKSHINGINSFAPNINSMKFLKFGSFYAGV